MSQIIKKVHDVDPNNSETVKEVLSSFFQNILKHTEANCNKWLRALENVLNRFPKYCSSHRTTIETYLSHFLSRSNDYDVIEAAKCAHALQQVQWPQDRIATAKSAWRDQMQLLCDSAHSLIDALFIDSVDIYKRGSKKIHAQLESSSPLTAEFKRISITGSAASTSKQALLQTRLRNTFIFMQAMIVEIYPVAKPVRPQTILDVIVRSLSVTSGKKPQSTDIAALKIQALRTLEALTACLGSNLIPFSPLVFRIVMQTFRWSSDNPNEGSRQVRRSTYDSLANWLTTLHCHRFAAGSTSWEDELTGHLVDDTTPPKKTVQLTMSSQSMKNLSKKAKRKLQNTMLRESTISTHMPGEKNKVSVEEDINNDVAMSALECAEVFLTVCGIFLKPTTHKIIQEHIVRECYNLSMYSDEYLLSLLRVLEASRKTTPPTVPPPTQYCLHLYSMLSNNHCREISKFCSQALLDIRLHLHCSPPSLNFALQIRPEKEKAIDKQKTISERNRVALQKLLGPDRMPELDNNREVITIVDEPLNKKPRLDDADKISLSSESVCSVEIPDDDSDDKDGETSNEVTNETESEEKKSDNEVTNPKTLNIEEVAVDVDEREVEKIEPAITEDIVNKEKIEPEKATIYEAKTQIPLNTSNDEIHEGEISLSMEVAYDYPNTGTEKVTVLEKMDDENLPSSNETDDIQITCGQVICISSQDIEPENKAKENEVKTTDVKIKVNGIDTNGDVNELETQVPVSSADKITKTDGISVEDMMADFVDEVIEQNVVA